MAHRTPRRLRAVSIIRPLVAVAVAALALCFTAVAHAEAPHNVTMPVISGQAVVGKTLTTSTGAWEPAPTKYTYSWERCNSAGAECAFLNVNTQSYTPVLGDVGYTLTVMVAAWNSLNQFAYVTDTPTALVTEAPAEEPQANCTTTGTVWCGDFDTGNASQYPELLGLPTSRVTYPTTPQDQLGGIHSARVELQHGDEWPEGEGRTTNRMQLRHAPWTEGQDLYFHFAVYIDPSTTIGGSFSNPWRMLVGWPTSQDGTCSPLKYFLQRSDGNAASQTGVDSLTVGGDQGACGAEDHEQWGLQNPVKGAWYEFITHIKFSATAGNGIWEFWMKAPGGSYVKQTFNHGTLNGKQTYTGATIGHAGMTANLRLGLYRSKEFTTTDIVYYDAVRAASTFAAAQ